MIWHPILFWTWPEAESLLCDGDLLTPAFHWQEPLSVATRAFQLAWRLRVCYC